MAAKAALLEASFSDCNDSTTSSTLTSVSSSTHSRRRIPKADRKATSRDTHSCNDDEPPPTCRNSAFLEVGLGGDDAIVDAKIRRDSRPKLQVRFKSKIDIVEPDQIDWSDTLPADRLPREPQMPPFFPTLPRLLFLALVIVLVAPSLHTSPLLKVDANPIGPKAGPVAGIGANENIKRGSLPQNTKRDDSPTVVCKRWAGQSAIVNGTLYFYGGRSTTTSDQTTDTWSMSTSTKYISMC